MTRIMLVVGAMLVAAPWAAVAEDDRLTVSEAYRQGQLSVALAPHAARVSTATVRLVLTNRTEGKLTVGWGATLVLRPEDARGGPMGWAIPRPDSREASHDQLELPAGGSLERNVEWLRFELAPQTPRAAVAYRAEAVADWTDDVAMIRLARWMAAQQVSHHVGQLALWHLIYEQPLHELRSHGQANLAELYLAESLVEAARRDDVLGRPPVRLALDVRNAAGPDFQPLAAGVAQVASRSHWLGLPVTLARAESLRAENLDELTLTLAGEMTLLRPATGLAARVTLRVHQGGRFTAWHQYETALTGDMEPRKLLDAVERGILNRLVRVTEPADGDRSPRIENGFRFALARVEWTARGDPPGEDDARQLTLTRLRLGPGRVQTWPWDETYQDASRWRVHRVAWGY